MIEQMGNNLQFLNNKHFKININLWLNKMNNTEM